MASESGAKKRRRKQQEEKLIESQRGSMFKFWRATRAFQAIQMSWR
jgi:hypothetical protein